MIVLYILAGIAALYLLFIAAPALIAFLIIFGRQKQAMPENAAASGEYYRPVAALLQEAAAEMNAVPHRDVSVTAKDGVTLRGRYYDLGFPATAVCVHGFRSSPEMNFGLLSRSLRKAGCNLLLVDQRAHGSSGGRLTGMGLLEQYDVPVWLDYLLANTGTEKLLLCGVSMGCFTLSMAAPALENYPVKGLVLDCGYRSVEEQVLQAGRERRLPMFLLLPLVRALGKLLLHADIRAEAAERLAENRIPALFLHGEDDTAVNPEDSKINCNACASEKRLLLVPGAEHTLALAVGGGEVRGAVEDFLARCLKSE